MSRSRNCASPPVPYPNSFIFAAMSSASRDLQRSEAVVEVAPRLAGGGGRMGQRGTRGGIDPRRARAEREGVEFLQRLSETGRGARGLTRISVSRASRSAASASSLPIAATISAVASVRQRRAYSCRNQRPRSVSMTAASMRSKSLALVSSGGDSKPGSDSDLRREKRNARSSTNARSAVGFASRLPRRRWT